LEEGTVICLFLFLCVSRFPGFYAAIIGIDGEEICDKWLRRLKIIISISETYSEVFQNWLKFYDNATSSFYESCQLSSKSTLYLLCLDTGTKSYLRSQGQSCSYTMEKSLHNYSSIFPLKSQFHNLWLARMDVLQSLLVQGYNVILSDSDALWLRNPFQDILLFRMSSVQIVASRGSHPVEVTKRLGVSLCMGFMYITSTHGTTLLFNEIYLKMLGIQGTHMADDQRELNLLLYKYGLRYMNRTTRDSFRYSIGTMDYREQHRIGIALLPQDQYRRTCKGVPRTVIKSSVVVHCYMPKNSVAKTKTLTELGLWRISDYSEH
jgi:hypothetical protein